MYWLGIDLGGTNIATGVVDENYNIIGRGKVKTDRSLPAEIMADDMVKAVNMAIADAGISKDEIVAMGIGSPGAVSPETGTVLSAANLNFNNTPLCKILKDKTGFDFYIENDANAAAYGELLAGAGRGKKELVAVTLGTGVGGGIIIDGKIYSGHNHFGAELGHMVIMHGGVKCGCGRLGCWEAYASASALIRQTKEAMENNKDSIMWEIAGSIDNVNGLTAFDGMRKGDKAATDVVKKYIEYISVGIVDIVNIFQPEVICIGGGISKEGDNLLLPLKEFIYEGGYVSKKAGFPELKIAELGNDAGIIGAAFLCNLYKDCQE